MKRKLTEKQIIKYKLYLQNEEKSRATIDKYIRDIRKFRGYLQSGRMGKAKVLEYKRYLIDHYRAVSVNSMLTALNSFFDWQGLQEFKVKPLKLQRQIFRPQEKELTKKEYNRLLKAAVKMNDVRLSLIMQTICATGIRVSELSFITVESLKEGCVQVNCKNKTRYVWIPKELCRQLRTYAAKEEISGGCIFITSRKKPIGRSFIWKQMKKAARVAGVENAKVYPHNLRHLFARTFYEMNKDIIKLSDILGHSSVETTRIYTMTSGKEYAVYIDKMGLVSKST